MDQIVAEYQEDSNFWSTWSHVFVAPNTGWLGFDQRLFIGNFFIGLQAQTNLAWNTQIPPGSTIISAELETSPFTAFFGNNDIQINSPNRALQLQKQDPMQAPFEVFRGWRRDQWATAQTGALSTTFTAVWGTSVTSNADWIIRQITAPGGTIPNRAQLGQLVTTRTGNMTLASAFWEMRRVGNPSGSVRLRIQGVTMDRGQAIPDGIDVAVSDDLLCSAVPLANTLQIFTWLPIASVTLQPLTDYFIILDADYPANNADYLVARHENLFLSNGTLMHFGDGLGMDWQNYPGAVDLNQAYSDVANDIAPSVIWPINSQAVNVPEISPDITSLIQAQVDMANYTLDHGMILNLTRLAVTAENRIQRANSFPGDFGPILRVTYEEPVVVVPDKMGDPYSGAVRNFDKRHNVEPFDLGYFKWKYGGRLQEAAKDQESISRDLEEHVPADLGPEDIYDDIGRLSRYIDEAEARAERVRMAAALREENDKLKSLAADIAAIEARNEAQRALIVQLEQNRIAARDALVLAMEMQRRQQNSMAAIAATMQLFY